MYTYHNKGQSQDSPQFSKEGLQALNSLTQDTSSTKPKSPLDSLVANGTITQNQADAIKSSFQSRAQATHGQAGMHHHHHGQQVQSTTESSQTTSQATDNLTEPSSSSL